MPFIVASALPYLVVERGRAALDRRLSMTLRTSFLTLACTVGLAGVAHAQRGGDDVPKAYRPPPGMCRIWLDKVPPKQQPAPTDCPTAVRNRPPNSRVLFGDDYVERPAKDDKKEIPFLKKFGNDKKP